jgi:hypothetical protein
VYKLQRVAIESHPLPELFATAVAVLPDITALNSGVYSPLSVGLVSALRAQGVDASCVHEGDQCIVRERLFGELVLQLAMGFGTAVAGAGAWAGLVTAFRLAVKDHPDSERRVRAKLVRQRTTAGGSTEAESFEYDGPLHELPDALAQLTWPTSGDGQEQGARRVDESRQA